MPPEASDAAYLWDMLDAARAATGFVSGKTKDEYLRDRLLQAAVERKIEIIGEAARKVSEQFRSTHPGIPWRPIIAQRHVLAHEYGEIIQERVWSVIEDHIPELIAALEPLVPPAPESAEP